MFRSSRSVGTTNSAGQEPSEPSAHFAMYIHNLYYTRHIPIALLIPRFVLLPYGIRIRRNGSLWELRIQSKVQRYVIAWDTFDWYLQILFYKKQKCRRISLGKWRLLWYLEAGFNAIKTLMLLFTALYESIKDHLENIMAYIKNICKR